MTSFDHITIPTCGNWFQINPLEHELDDRAGNTEFSVSMVTHTQKILCVLPMVLKISHFSGKFDQHLSLYCGSVKPKFKTGSGYWFL